MKKETREVLIGFIVGMIGGSLILLYIFILAACRGGQA